MSLKVIYRLVAAVLTQAIRDFRGNSRGWRRSALRWLNSPDQSAFSLIWVCQVLNRDPSEVQHFSIAKRSHFGLSRERG